MTSRYGKPRTVGDGFRVWRTDGGLMVERATSSGWRPVTNHRAEVHVWRGPSEAAFTELCTELMLASYPRGRDKHPTPERWS